MPTDTSHTERIRYLRARVQATARLLCPACPESNGPVDQSVFISRQFGTQFYLRPQANGVVVTETVISAAPAPPVED